MFHVSPSFMSKVRIPTASGGMFGGALVGRHPTYTTGWPVGSEPAHEVIGPEHIEYGSLRTPRSLWEPGIHNIEILGRHLNTLESYDCARGVGRILSP